MINHLSRVHLNIHSKIKTTLLCVVNDCLLSAVRLKCTKNKAKEPPWRILFFGTGSFALESLRPLCAKFRTGTLISELGVVSFPGTLIREFALSEKLDIYDYPVSPELIRESYDIGMVAQFGKLIPKNIIESFPLGCINVHGSILPRWRGAAPLIHSIMNGDTESGVTIMRMHPHRFDIGEIVRQYRLSVGPTETSVELEKRCAVAGAQLLMECLRDMPRCVERAVPQPEQGITYAPKIHSGMAKVRWRDMSSRDIYNLHRALSHIYHLTTSWKGKTPVKLIDFSPDSSNAPSISDPSAPKETSDNKLRAALDFLNDSKSAAPIDHSSEVGRLFVSPLIGRNRNNRIVKVLCCDNRFIIINKIRISGKTMTAMDFYHGYLAQCDDSEWFFVDT